MARPLPVNLLMAGTGAVLLVSGISGEPIGKVLQGEFGDVKGTKQAALENAEQGQAQSAQMLSSSTFAPSPASLSVGATGGEVGVGLNEIPGGIGWTELRKLVAEGRVPVSDFQRAIRELQSGKLAKITPLPGKV